MVKSNVNAKIADGKVILSQIVLETLESWKTDDEKAKLVEKYKSILLDPYNLNALKFRQHHIIPAFMFKDENHKNRKETDKLANSIEGNKIKLSLSNHIIVHNIIRQIFPNNHDARMAVYIASGNLKGNLDYLTDKEIKEIAKIQEECSKENLTEEESKARRKNYRSENKEILSKKKKEYYEQNKDEIHEKRKKKRNENREGYNRRAKEYYRRRKNKINQKRRKDRAENKEKYAKKRKKYRDNHKLEISKQKKISYEKNKDKILKKNKESYKKNKDKISKQKKKSYIKNKDKILERNNEYRKNHTEKIREHNHLLCFDPVKKDYCFLQTLHARKSRNKNLYNNVIPSDCIIKEESVE